LHFRGRMGAGQSLENHHMESAKLANDEVPSSGQASQIPCALA
jgi:hypothetical protein